MKPLYPLSASTVIAALFCASAAHADLTAEQVWQSWVDYYSDAGQSVTAGSTERQGDTLVITDMKFVADMPDTKSEGSISEIRLTETGDGSVDVTLPREIPISIHATPGLGEPSDVSMIITQTDLKMNFSGSVENMNMVYSAPEFGLSLDQLSVEGAPAPFKMKLTFKGNSGTSTMQDADSRNVTSDMKSEAVDLAMTAADPQGTGTFNMTGQFNGLSGTTTMVMPGSVDMSDMNAAMKAGLLIDGTFAYMDGTSHIEAEGPDGDFAADSIAAGGSLAFKMSQDGIEYGGESGATTMKLSGAAMPFPFEAAIANSAFKIAMPVSKSETPVPASVLIKLVDLSISDTLWGMFDPTAQLPRDPATLVIDITGAMRPLIDLFDPAQTEALAKEGAESSPFELTAAKINAVQLKVAGAELTGDGDVTFDNSAETPMPVGEVNLNLTGANALMDKLVAMGLVPQDQVMGARMMLGLFATPTGDDALSSKIEFKDGGSIFANGQQIQ
jgi:hypothetical protein